jgi:hypothetical protein
MSYHAWGKAKIWCIESEETLDVREHKGIVLLYRGRGGYWLISSDGENCFCCNYTTHAMSNEHSVYGRIHGGRWCAICNFQVYDFVLQPAPFIISCDPSAWECAVSYHSLKRATHSCKSPLVSNFGYCICTTWTFGKAWLRRARRCEGKLTNVSSPPWVSSVSTQAEAYAPRVKRTRDRYLEAVNKTQ